jgi:hypothetical protein
MPWATISDVDDLTSKTVTDPDIVKAQAVIEIHVSRTELVPSDTIGTRDLHWLKLAVAYQTVWMLANPDIYERTEQTTLLQDGVEARDMPPDALTIAPLARRAIRRLSWKKSRSVHTPSHFEESGALYPVGGPVIDYPGEPWEDL